MTNIVTAADKMAELIEQDSLILPFAGRFGILMNFRDKSIETVCREYDIDVSMFLCLLNTYINRAYSPEISECRFMPSDLIPFLKNSHDYFLETYFGELGALLARIFDSRTGSCHDDDNLIIGFFETYKREMMTHFESEEKETFPYIASLSAATMSDAGRERHRALYGESGKEILNDTHYELEMKISDLKSLIIRYVTCKHMSADIYNLMFTAARFERDMHNHIQIEERVLIPIARMIEKRLKNTYAQQ